LKVDIVIRHAVHNQESLVTGQSLSIANRSILVALWIVLRSVHVALRIDTIIESPIGNRCDSHTVPECLTGVLFERFESHKTAVRPTPDSNVVGVDVWLCGPDLGRLDLVAGFVVAEVTADYAAGSAADKASAATIHGDDNGIEVRADEGLEVVLERAGYLLGARPAVDLEEDGVFVGWIKVRGKALDDLERCTVDDDVLVAVFWKSNRGKARPEI